MMTMLWGVYALPQLLKKNIVSLATIWCAKHLTAQLDHDSGCCGYLPNVWIDCGMAAIVII